MDDKNAVNNIIDDNNPQKIVFNFNSYSAKSQSSVERNTIIQQFIRSLQATEKM